ncbi:Transcriptional activator of acetoin dehydrogenase operon AcoR [Candidatus Burkholderia humilis]|nr:Transcriptional activator of acetoin dehydrogenase operon AcoR [Candidatus Burkholderia humilis]
MDRRGGEPKKEEAMHNPIGAAGAALQTAHVDVIHASHERSATFGLYSSMRPEYAVLTGADFAEKIDESRALFTHALPVMETLYAQIANTHSMIALTDASGLILHSLGDDDFLARAQKVALRAGAVWSEEHQGTNAIGTTIAAREAVTVHGDQHYLQANHFLTCSSVPILDPRGNLSGVLDVTGDRRGYHQHTMALVKMSGQMIENRLIASTFSDGLRIHFHSRPEFIGTLMEGIAAFDLDGRLLSANRSAQFQLELGRLRAQTLASLFGVNTDELIARVGEPASPLQLHSGVGMFASVEFHARAAAPVIRKPAASNLAALCTGDARTHDIVGRVRKVIGKNIPILIGGETGAGKEMLANAIHRDSPRRAGPFVVVNCASLPETLIEAELFGYAQDTFTGTSKRGAVGKIVQANGGTLFLDEIGDMPLAMQSRLLRVLQERVVEPLGAARAVPVDFMLICASNRKLREQVAQGEFRERLRLIDAQLRGRQRVVEIASCIRKGDGTCIVAELLRRVLDGVLLSDQLAIEILIRPYRRLRIRVHGRRNLLFGKRQRCHAGRPLARGLLGRDIGTGRQYRGHPCSGPSSVIMQGSSLRSPSHWIRPSLREMFSNLKDALRNGVCAAC